MSIRVPDQSISVDDDSQPSQDVESDVENSASTAIDRSPNSSMPITFLDDQTTLPAEVLRERKIIFPGMADQQASTSYRELRTKLVSGANLSQRTILVAPLVSGDHGADVAVNLAAAFAFDERRAALLIDCDFQRDSVADKLGLEPGLGLLDFLSDRDVTSDEIVRPSGIRRFRVVSRGADRALTDEYVTSPRLRLFLDEMKQRVQEWFIIINAPAVLESADAPVLADMCDQAILVVPYGRVTKAKVSQAVDSIGSSRVSGVVFAH